MSVRVGWTAGQPGSNPDRIGRSVGLFDYASIKDGRARKFVVGYLRLDAADLLRLRARGAALDVRVVGVMRIAADVTAHLFEDVVRSAKVTGVTRAPSLERARR